MVRYIALGAALALLVTASPGRASDDPDTLVRTKNPERYQIVISATKIPKRAEEVPNAVSVVSGDELRRRGTCTLAEALQDAAGLDTGEGSDNGTTVPEINKREAKSSVAVQDQSTIVLGGLIKESKTVTEFPR